MCRLFSRLHLLPWLLLGTSPPTARGSSAKAGSANLLDANPNAIAANAPAQDCQLFGWSAWSDCLGASTFGVPTGVHTRKRALKQPERGTEGKPCSTPMFDAALCLTSTGVADSRSPGSGLTGAIGTGADEADPSTLNSCTLAEWGMWSGCMRAPDPRNAGTQSCGYSYEIRIRPPLNAPCLIPDAARSALSDCSLDSLGKVRGCKTKVSDQGSVLESRVCPISICNADCIVSTWSTFSTCSQSCGAGSKSRKRGVTQSPGGSGLPCPHLSESSKCKVTGCNTDCKVGDFGLWGKCTRPVTNLPQGVQPAKPGTSSSSSCVRKRARPVLTQQAGSGNPCPKIQQFMNCPCPIGTPAPQMKGKAASAPQLTEKAAAQNTTTANGGSVWNITAWMPPWNFTGWKKITGNGTASWLGGLRTQAQQRLQQLLPGANTWIKQLGVDTRTLVGIGGVTCLLLCCFCVSCCRWLCPRKTIKKRTKVVSYDEGGTGNSNALEANEEDDSNDRTSLLSQRTPAYSTQARLEQPQQAWQVANMRQLEGRDGPMLQHDPRIMLQEVHHYDSMPRSNPGYPGYPEYASQGASGASLGVYGASPGAYGAPYEGRSADHLSYGGMLAPSSSPGYIDNRAASSYLDYYASLPPQYHQNAQAQNAQAYSQPTPNAIRDYYASQQPAPPTPPQFYRGLARPPY